MGMERERKEELRGQLETMDISLKFLALLILSVCLSWRALAVQREGLRGLLLGEREDMPDVFPARLTASALVVGALVWFFGVTLDVWEQSREGDRTARRSGDLNAWAALLVLAAALLRLYDLVTVQRSQPGLEEEIPPGALPLDPASSSRAPYPSLPVKAESSLIPPLLLSQRGPLRWARVGTPEKDGRKLYFARIP